MLYKEPRRTEKTKMTENKEKEVVRDEMKGAGQVEDEKEEEEEEDDNQEERNANRTEVNDNKENNVKNEKAIYLNTKKESRSV